MVLGKSEVILAFLFFTAEISRMWLNADVQLRLEQLSLYLDGDVIQEKRIYLQ